MKLLFPAAIASILIAGAAGRPLFEEVISTLSNYFTPEGPTNFVQQLSDGGYVQREVTEDSAIVRLAQFIRGIWTDIVYSERLSPDRTSFYREARISDDKGSRVQNELGKETRQLCTFAAASLCG